ncbi:toxin co-regulated pilus biosynthesis Q family protein [Rugamonas sp. CCM 8940]|uniref:toxin co-regulated pilus biosynthesis Q family protein n=1 Tax=Rugamonas sp. CCM 8940 TaxID=2765359 RepID=UPI001F236952|nr:toxin co-regulated pilus biosynthesis Q family protein [Rugamonas sp. CCM 8940]
MMDIRSKARLRAALSAHLAGALMYGICVPVLAAPSAAATPAAAKQSRSLKLERALRFAPAAPANADCDDDDGGAPLDAGLFTLGGATPGAPLAGSGVLSAQPPDVAELAEKNIVIVSHSRAAVALSEAPSSWEIVPTDRTLNAALARWAAQAGWQLVWELPVDYAVDARTKVSGSFQDAVAMVAKGMEGAEIPLKAIFYAGNKVLRIVPKGVE